MSGGVPRALDLPTGLGKTSVMATWLVARACGAKQLPRRLIYVVDRRAVVDQATSEAIKLRDWVNNHPDVADQLGLAGRSLPISTLRGQFVDNREWLELPSSPAIVVGTVDMIGSRLLFEGYACSRKMRPYHAGLVACDTLFVLDEAHLVPPFERLVDAAQHHAVLWPSDVDDAKMIPRLRVMSLSATGRTDHDSVFRLDSDDRDHPIVRKRLDAPKHVEVERLGSGEKLHDALARRAWELAEATGDPSRVLIYSNRRDDTERARDALLKHVRGVRGAKAALPAAELMVGARRVRERSLAEAWLRESGFLSGGARPLDHCFLFATSAGEVGVDLDADHLVADVVAWERMVQRFGRVNRRGERHATLALIVDPDADESGLVERVTELIGSLPSIVDPALADGVHDASPSSLVRLRDQYPEEVSAATTPAPLYPALTRPLLDAWSMTSLAVHPGRPEVAPWLRGWVDDTPQTDVVWRRHFSPGPPDLLSTGEPEWAALYEAAPPHVSEVLSTESFRAALWLRARAEKLKSRSDDDGATIYRPDSVLAVSLDRAGEFLRTWSLADLTQPGTPAKDRLTRELGGNQLIVDARMGGLSPTGLLDAKEDAEPQTGELGDAKWMAASPSASGSPHDAPVVRFRIVIQRGDAEMPVEDVSWRERRRFPWSTSVDEETDAWLVIEKWRHDGATEEDRSAGHPQSLVEHQDWTAREADQLARALGLPDRYRDVLVLAARLHDEGKRARRWQQAFSAPTDDLYAKTRGPVNVRHLDGYRHELGSLPLAMKDADFAALAPDDRELVLHLIAAHHGFARPCIGTGGCDDAPPSMVEARTREVALRFVALQERWGPWGLAWLETLLRAADQRASRANEQRGDE